MCETFNQSQATMAPVLRNIGLSAGPIYRISDHLIGAGQNHKSSIANLNQIMVPFPRLAIMPFFIVKILENSPEKKFHYMIAQYYVGHYYTTAFCLYIHKLHDVTNQMKLASQFMHNI